MIAKLRKASESREFDLSDSFSEYGKRITQTRYFTAGDIVVAIGELNRPNNWNDAKFDTACAFLQKAWNDAVKAASGV